MKGLLVETDVIVEFLVAPPDRPPLMRRLLQTATLYCTFIQAAEIYSVALDDLDRRTVERALFGLKILGASGRYAGTVARTLSALAPDIDYRTAIIAAMALESKLPIVTGLYRQAYRRIPNLRLISASDLPSLDSLEDLESALFEG